MATACSGGQSEPSHIRPGAISIAALTTGSDLDPDGFQFRLDGGSLTPLQTTDTVLLSGVDPGAHTLLLSSIAANCSLAEPNPTTIQVTEGSIPAWTYHVACAAVPPATGTARILLQTVGLDPDQDGYTYAVDGGAPTATLSTQTVLVPNLPPGPHSIGLGGLAPNCTLSQANPQTHNVTAGALTDFPFDITCSRRTDQILFNGSAGISIINADGSGSRLLVPMPFYVESPSWRPDRLRLAFGVSAPVGTIYTASYLGSDTIGFVVAPGLPAVTPSYSPDGTRLAFVVDYCGVIWTMAADGSSAAPISNSPSCLLDPAWSPDGAFIAYVETGVANGGSAIARMGADGSNAQPLTPGGSDNRTPAWSPDGLRIAFSSNRSGSYRIYLMNADGSDVHAVTDSMGYDDQPTWSPDGTRIVFRSLRLGFPHLFVVDSAGTNLLPLTGNSGSAENSPAWHR